MEDLHRYDQANAAITDWAKLVRKKLVQRVGSLTLKDRRALQKAAWNKLKDPDYKPLAQSVGYNTKYDFGQISRINFRFSRQGIFLERGAGRNRRPGPHAKSWIVPVLDPAIDELADLLVEQYADVVSGEFKFTIPGIIGRRVKLTVDPNK